MSLADLIKQRRAALGINQKELALRAGVGQPYVSLLESGKRHPNPKQQAFISTLARVLMVSTDEVYLAINHAPPDLITALTNADHVRTVRSALNIPTPE